MYLDRMYTDLVCRPLVRPFLLATVDGLEWDWPEKADASRQPERRQMCTVLPDLCLLDALLRADGLSYHRHPARPPS